MERRWMILTAGVILVLLVSLIAVGSYYGGFNDGQKTFVAPRIVSSAKWQDVICNKQQLKCPESFKDPPLIIISLDGFRPDYLEKGLTPSLKKIQQCGVRAPYMRPVYPTKTFPNHYSQVTGLFPESHGIIDNNMYENGKQFKIFLPEARKSYWWEGEPIWVTAEKQGKKCGAMYWPGSDVEIKGTYPSYYLSYSSKFSFSDRVKKVMEWLALPVDKRPSFFTMYANQPDHNAHKYGPFSKEVDSALKDVDAMIDELMTELNQAQLLSCINIIIVSDHGMAEMQCSRTVVLGNYINTTNIHFTGGPLGRITPKKNSARAVDDLVGNLSCKTKEMLVYKRLDLPKRYHYTQHRRIDPIVLDIKSGWSVSKYPTKDGDGFCTGGTHGYDNKFPDMKALFLAYGSDFKTNFTTKPFMNIELYNLMADLLNITPAPNNGTSGSLHYLLKNPPKLTNPSLSNPLEECKEPNDDYEKEARIRAAQCTSCDDFSLAQNAKSKETIDKKMHLPWGIGNAEEDQSYLCFLVNENYVSGFHSQYKMSLWTSYTISKENINHDLDPCWKGDARIPASNTPRCSDYTHNLFVDSSITQEPLYPPGFSLSSDREWLVSNSVPMYPLSASVHKQLHTLFIYLANKYESINIVTGPVFDVDGTGLKSNFSRIRKSQTQNPLIVPTHFFHVVTYCGKKNIPVQSCSPLDLNVFSFMLPNLPKDINCQALEHFLAHHTARVLDVEIATGLQFFSSYPFNQTVHLKTFDTDEF